MQTSDVRVDVVIPEKGVRTQQMKYPFESMEKGQVRILTLDESDADMTVEKLKKNVVNAAKAYENRLGKMKDGGKVKDFATWIAETDVEVFGEDGPQAVKVKAVFLGCREDRSAEKMIEIESAEEAAGMDVKTPAGSTAKKAKGKK